MQISRRAILAAPLLATVSATLPHVALAAAAPARQAPGFYRYKIGELEVTALNDGVWNRPLDDKFVRNAPFPDVRKAMADAFLPENTLPIPFTTLLVNTGSKLILLDTGTGGQLAPTAGTMSANLAAAGVDARAIETIIISHFHPDHINGLKTKENALVFPNAEVNVPSPEWAYWMDDGKMSTAPEGLQGNFRNVRRVFGDMADRIKRYEPGKDVAPGIGTIAAYGHTPGHTAFTISSGSQSLLALSDTANHPALFVRQPEWSPVFDMDQAMGIEARKRLLDRAAADRMRIAAYHFPFPATGYVARRGIGYDFIPAQWQPSL